MPSVYFRSVFNDIVGEQKYIQRKLYLAFRESVTLPMVVSTRVSIHAFTEILHNKGGMNFLSEVGCVRRVGFWRKLMTSLIVIPRDPLLGTLYNGYVNDNGMSVDHFNRIASKYDLWKKRNRFYYESLKAILSGLVREKEATVLDFGCGTGDLLHHLAVEEGVGYDPSSEMITLCKTKYPQYEWSNSIPNRQFDYVFSVDVIEHVPDLRGYFSEIRRTMNSDSLAFIIFANPSWEFILLALEKLNLKMPEGPHERYNRSSIRRTIHSCEMKIIRTENYLPRISKVGLIEVWHLKTA